jgi:hypothetical protein
VVEPVPDVTASYGENFDLRAGGTAALRDTPFSIRFERVVEDSRCPAGVNCVWAGEAVVRLHLRSGADSSTVDLRTTDGPNREGSLQTFRVRLIRVMPAPRDGVQIKPDQYVATLSIQRNRQDE